MKDIIKDKEAYNEITEGYTFIATYLTEPKGSALIEIKKDDKLIKEFLFPSYKIYNILAHAKDIADGLNQDSDSGLYEAGSNGLGGNSYGT